ncbi:hypothetical protein [Bradyrhizobium sp. B120]|uniref:hypothetical protein n=1 Tax=Bradyrhizobium sp. B120 TaxID=3410088 RepID=UPI003B980DE6
MLDFIGLHEEYALVSPQTFVDRVSHEWTTSYHNVPSASLRKLWASMASTYQEAIVDTATGVTPRWRVLWPPTGSGKTLGAKVYAALQAEQNAAAAKDRKPVGILIVTRLIAQADEMVAGINALAGRQVAVADHTDHRATNEQLSTSAVLVITHQAYVNATQTLTSTQAGKWERLTHWRGGRRLLTIVDEALCNVIEESQVKVDRLGQAIGFIPFELRTIHAAEVEALETLYVDLGHHAGVSAGFGGGACMAWGPEGAAHGPVSLGPLRAAMLGLPYDNYIGKNDATERNRIAGQIDKTLAAAEAVLDQYAYFALKGKEPTLNSSALVVPLDAPGPVVLDATAREDFIYKLMEDRAVTIPTPSGVRDYSSVTLRVAWTRSGIGKGTMVERAKTRFPRLIQDLTQRLGPERKVFFCVHKAVEHELPEASDLPFAKVAKAHWGAVDGSNDYADCDAAVIFGLPFRDATTWPSNVFFALQGVQGDDWLDNPTWNGQLNLREHMVRRQLAASVIQAINRICIRRVTDEHGGCPAADVFIVLPSGDRGNDILASIRREMPGINVADWPFDPDAGPKARKRGAGTPHGRLLTFMENRAPGRTSLQVVARELGLKPNAKKELQKYLRNENHPTTLALRAIGVTYVVSGKGRGGKSELVKAA